MDPRDVHDRLDRIEELPLAERAAAVESIELSLRAELDALAADEPGG